MIEKKVVHYVGTPHVPGIGLGALVTPIDHPDTENVSNERVARTSPVRSWDKESGRLETANTIYIPYHKDDEGGFVYAAY